MSAISSKAGRRQGFSDEKGRGNVFFKVRKYLQVQQPKVFILENVGNLMILKKGEFYKAIMHSLKAMKTYNIVGKIVNTRDHGIPQNRSRLYICGILKTCDTGTFRWPVNVECPCIEEFIEPRKERPSPDALPSASNRTKHDNVRRMMMNLNVKGCDPLNNTYILDCDSSERFTKVMRKSSCITRLRYNGIWISNRGRYYTKDEMLRLQGMPTVEEDFLIVVPPNQIGMQIGNAMSCNVLERIFCQLLPAADLVPASMLHDRWDGTTGIGPGSSSASCARAIAAQARRHMDTHACAHAGTLT